MLRDEGDEYEGQTRGALSAYERYLSGMDASMKQKVALTAAHLRGEGRVADMGMGSGTGSEALAALYPAMEVIGVDVSETMVDLARDKYELPNLSFELGDIAKPVFPAGHLSGILNSSVLHHVTSFNGYGSERAREALEAQVPQLCDGGILIVRDFLRPKDAQVFLDLPGNDARDGEGPEHLSTAALFESFAASYRPLLDEPGFEWQEVSAEGVPEGWKRYQTRAEFAVEFLLRKDYRRDWESELKEAYCYFTQEEFESVYAALGLRVLASTPIWNPWIVGNRFEGKYRWFDEGGTTLEHPATNYIIVGEKVADGEGVRFEEADECPAKGFLSMLHYRHRGSGKVMDLVRRPHRTLDVIPWFESEGRVFVMARASYPRPIITCKARGTSSLDSRHSAGYVVEPLLVLQDDKPIGMTIEESLERDADIGSAEIRAMRVGSTYYPSPGGLLEEVRSTFVEVEPSFEERGLRQGRVLSIEAQQVLRAAQVAGLPDARLELNVYDLLLDRGASCGPWIGDVVELSERGGSLEGRSLAELEQREHRRQFEAVAEGSGFLNIHCASFTERDQQGRCVGETELEFVLPSRLSHNTVATALLCKVEGEVYLGIDDDDLPAAQGFVGNSELLVAPAWRLPREVRGRTSARAWIEGKLAEEYGLEASRVWELGGPYYPSLGATPEVVHPLAIEVSPSGEGARRLHWLRLREAVERRDALRDGHLKILLLRAAHALGLLG